MGPISTDKRNNLLVQSVVAAPDKFDEVFDKGLKDYLTSGVQAIIDERIAKYESVIEKK